MIEHVKSFNNMLLLLLTLDVIKYNVQRRADDACGAAAPHTAQLSTPFAVAREHDAHTQCVRMSSVERDQSRRETTAAPAAATTALEQQWR